MNRQISILSKDVNNNERVQERWLQSDAFSFCFMIQLLHLYRWFYSMSMWGKSGVHNTSKGKMVKIFIDKVFYFYFFGIIVSCYFKMLVSLLAISIFKYFSTILIVVHFFCCWMLVWFFEMLQMVLEMLLLSLIAESLEAHLVEYIRRLFQ